MSFVLLYITRTLMITQIEVLFLQTTLASPESLRNARHEWGGISLALQGTTLLVQKQMWKARIAWERWHRKVKPHQTLIRHTKPKPEKLQLGPVRQNWKMWLPGQDPSRKALKSQEAGTKKSVRVCLVQTLPLFSHLKQMVFIWLKNKEQNFEPTPAAPDNSSRVSKVAKQNKTRHSGLNPFWWVTSK